MARDACGFVDEFFAALPALSLIYMVQSADLLLL